MSAEPKRPFIRLRPGVEKRHFVTFLFASYCTIGLAVLVNTLQPYLLTNFLHVEPLAQGAVAGTAASVGEVVMLFSVIAWGIYSDRRGRRLVWALTIFIVGIAYAVTPASGSVVGLMLTRSVFSIGIAGATGMLATIVGDYVVDADRGRATGVGGILNGLGAVTAAVLISKLPRVLNDRGMDGTTAGWTVYLGVAVFASVAALIMYRGLAPNTDGEQQVGFGALLREGMGAARQDAGIALAYSTAFVARADIAMAGLFMPQWCVSHLLEHDTTGATQLALSAQGIERGGALIGAMGAGALLASPLAGIFADRLRRTTAVAIALTMNFVSYGLTAFLSDPFGKAAIVIMACIGVSEIAGLISTQVLIQQQAPPRIRGSVLGAFGMWGALGIMVNSFIGGQLFTHWMFQGPFLWLAGLNLIVAVLVVVYAGRVVPPAIDVDVDGDGDGGDGANGAGASA